MGRKTINERKQSKNVISDIMRTIMFISGNTQEDFAQYLNVSVETIYRRFMKGDFTMEEVIKLCDYCDFNMSLVSDGIEIDVSKLLSAHKVGDEDDE